MDTIILLYFTTTGKKILYKKIIEGIVPFGQNSAGVNVEFTMYLSSNYIKLPPESADFNIAENLFTLTFTLDIPNADAFNFADDEMQIRKWERHVVKQL